MATCSLNRPLAQVLFASRATGSPRVTTGRPPREAHRLARREDRRAPPPEAELGSPILIEAHAR